MKRNRKFNLFGWLAVSTLLLTTACAGVADLDGAQANVNGSNTVTFTIQPQTQTGGMRDANDPDDLTKNITISRGDKIDVLIFAVYKKVDNDWVVQPKYSKGDISKYATTLKGYTLQTDNSGKSCQTVIDATRDNYPMTLQFVFDDDGVYKVAFWAQSGNTSAFDLSNGLDKVQVIYANAENNDELRDAFCEVSGEVTAGMSTPQTVTLTRPFAQINVGTAGWDYEGAAYLRPSQTSYTESNITVKGVAQYYNVVNGYAYGQSTNAVFKENTIPAFINVYGTDAWNNLTYKPFEKDEEFLRVHVSADHIGNNAAEYDPYRGWKFFNDYRLDNTIKDGEEQSSKEKYEAGIYPDTEVFKYLSMCYVLPKPTSGISSAPARIEGTGGEGALNAGGTGSTVDVEFTFYGIEMKDGKFDTSTDNYDPSKWLNQKFVVNNVPVQENWRTNILGNSFFTFSPKFYIDVVPEYMGDYNYNSEYEDEDGNTWGPPTDKDWPTEEGYIYSVKFNGKDEQSTTDEKYEGNFFYFGDVQKDASGKDIGGNKHDFNAKFSGKYNNDNYTSGLKMEGSTLIQFTTSLPANVLIVQSTWESNNVKQTIKFDDVELPISSATTPSGSTGVRLYTLSEVESGTHKITRGSGESGVFYVEVQTLTDIVDDSINEGSDVEDGDYYKKDDSANK